MVLETRGNTACRNICEGSEANRSYTGYDHKSLSLCMPWKVITTLPEFPGPDKQCPQEVEVFDLSA